MTLKTALRDELSQIEFSLSRKVQQRLSFSTWENISILGNVSEQSKPGQFKRNGQVVLKDKLGSTSGHPSIPTRINQGPDIKYKY